MAFRWDWLQIAILKASCFFLNVKMWEHSMKYILGGGLKYFLFSPLLGEMIQIDKYFSNGLKLPTRILNSGFLRETRISLFQMPWISSRQELFPVSMCFGRFGICCFGWKNCCVLEPRSSTASRLENFCARAIRCSVQQIGIYTLGSK